LFRVRQHFERTQVPDVAAEVESQLGRLALGDKVLTGQSVAVSAGSRGIANIDTILKAAVDHLLRLGAKPFIVPAMGSHGGGTAEGQQAILERYGITETRIGCPIRASMETVVVCQTPEGVPVHFDRFAFEADHVLVCRRVKPHTNFVGDIESGLMKMMLIGLGKHEGAKVYHRAIHDYSFGHIVRSVATEVLAKCDVVAGLAIVENAYDETALIEAVSPERFESREKELLVLARQWIPRLPFERCDLLLIDEIGKDISGAGMDTNVVGRKYLDHRTAEHETPKVKWIAVRGLTEQTHGNAAGIGIADFCTRRTVEQTDWSITKINCMTAGNPQGAMTPVVYDADRELLSASLPALGMTQPKDARILWIRDTLHLAEVECSEVYLDEARERDDLQIIASPRKMEFDARNNLLPLESILAGG